MDPSDLREKLRDYASRDSKFRESNWSVPEDSTVSSGPVSRESLLHTYRRRLRRVGEDVELRAATEQLISFLDEYTGEELNMVSYRTEENRTRLFLADSENRQILFWMSMFK